MANPTIHIGVQVRVKTGTIIIYGPDGEPYPVKASEDQAKTAEQIGQQILEIYSDPEQQEAEQAIRRAQAAPPPAAPGQPSINGAGADIGAAEGHLRNAMDAALPGSSKLLSWLQELSAHNAEESR